MDYDNELSRQVIGRAIEVHRMLGPGLLESVYEECLCYDLAQSGIQFARQQRMPIVYKGVELDCDFRLDLVVDGSLIVEIKAVQQVLPIHEAQLLTYLKVSGIPMGLLLNFNEAMLKQGIRRRVI